MKTTRQIKLLKQVQTICEFDRSAAPSFGETTATTGTDPTNSTIVTITSHLMAFAKKN
ncbi:hypothetical protein [Mucilaginibacter ginkgonis]|uniref:Uncharacterized protein n=1 Tax=Mucilaginibacter ginkgonis TaxID=2682091 RepID=A0A6I4HV59_9SPHI|nr:hypothetical protein [Mucilaginibacter ginkgonis]QQL49973.1 hypothetical protein GO620_000545 [Mucilaginibacter ginkgonis]